MDYLVVAAVIFVVLLVMKVVGFAVKTVVKVGVTMAAAYFILKYLGIDINQYLPF